MRAVTHWLRSLWDGWFSPAPEPADREATLPFDLYLTIGFGSVRLFEAGAIDEFRFFQRGAVPADHRIEFLSRLDPVDAGSEDYKPYGLFRLDPAQERDLFDSEAVMRLWRILQRRGLLRPPDPFAFMDGDFRTYDPSSPGSEGSNRLVPRPGALATARRGCKRLSYAEILDTLRAAMAPREKIAWIEDAFSEPPPPGEIVHRYYLGTNQQAYLVRHHWEHGKQLYEAETSAQAIAVCLASGNYSRPRAA